MPQISPLSWTLIVIIIITFISVINSNMPKTNNTINPNNKVTIEKNTINW